MANILDAVETYVDMFTTGRFPIPPKADTLGAHSPDLRKLPRDDDHIICQPHASTKPGKKGKTFPPMHTLQGDRDGGDSAAREGVAAFCQSAQDKGLLGRFVSHGIMVRHPKQPPWNNPLNCSRDQLLAFSAGCWRAGLLDISQSLLRTHNERGYLCQNIEADEPGTIKKPPDGPDILLPDDVMYLHICAGEKSMFLEPFGQLALQLAVEVAPRAVSWDKTNLMLECIVCGRLNLFVQKHPDWKEMLNWYFYKDNGGARDLKELADQLIWVVEEELKRYPDPVAPLLPSHTLNFLKTLDLRKELSNINVSRHNELRDKFTDAVLKDTADVFINKMNYTIEMVAKQLKELNATANQIVEGLKRARQDPREIQKVLAEIGINPTDIGQAIHVAFPGVVVPPLPNLPTPPPPPSLPIPIPIPIPIPKIPNPFGGGVKFPSRVSAPARQSGTTSLVKKNRVKKTAADNITRTKKTKTAKRAVKRIGPKKKDRN